MKHDERIRKRRGEEIGLERNKEGEQECFLKLYNDSLRV